MSVFTQTTDTTLPSTKIQCKNKIKPIIIKQEGLEKLLSKVKVNPSKSSGPDNIPNRILKECAVQLAPILQKIYPAYLKREINTDQKTMGLYR
jgi:hypothetical protein